MSEEIQHPISLRQVFFTKSIVCANPSHNPGQQQAVSGPTNNININKIEGSDRTYQVVMNTTIESSNDSNQPYQIEMECVGVFEVDQTLSDEEAIRGVTITAHSVLFGAIREAVSWLTARQPFGTLTLGLSVLKPVTQSK